jgi:hypothetical protein
MTLAGRTHLVFPSSETSSQYIYRTYRRVIVVEVNPRVLIAIESRNRNQWPWIAITTSSNLYLGTVDKELSAVWVGCIVDADVLDSEEIRAIRQRWRELEGVAREAWDGR